MNDDIEQIIPDGYDRLTDPVTIFWYDHDCETITKYCDDHHKQSAQIIRIVLESITGKVTR